MDSVLQEIITNIKNLKQELYAKYKPELVDGIKVIHQPSNIMSVSSDQEEAHPKAYEKLIKAKHKLLRKPTRSDPVVTTREINFHSSTESQGNSDLSKPWIKLPSAIKIQAVTNFINAISPDLSPEHIHQLRYLLVASVTDKILDVDYDEVRGHIRQIRNLRLDPEQGQFLIASNLAKEQMIGLSSFRPAESPPSKPKIVLKKKL